MVPESFKLELIVLRSAALEVALVMVTVSLAPPRPVIPEEEYTELASEAVPEKVVAELAVMAPEVKSSSALRFARKSASSTPVSLTVNAVPDRSFAALVLNVLLELPLAVSVEFLIVVV